MMRWEPVADWPGYNVSDQGHVRSNSRPRKGRPGTVRERLLKQTVTVRGYAFVTLYDGDRSETIAVHRLVARAFVPNPSNLPEVNHMHEDGDKLRNVWDNLEWCTHVQNMEHARTVLGTFRTPPKFSPEVVEQVRSAVGSTRAIAARYGVSKSQVAVMRRE